MIFDDAALDQAVEGIVNGIYFNQGHVCCAGSRLLVQESIYEPVIAKLKRRMGTLRVGDPLDKNTDVGAINSKEQLERIQELVAAGEEEGAEIYQPPCKLPEKGWFFAPTVFTNVAQSYRIAQEEIFGPVLSVLTFRTPDEAVEKANNTAYGLSAGIWTEKGSRILSMAARLRAGVVWGEHVQPLRPDVALRRLQGVRLRARGRPPGARALPRASTASRRRSADEPARRQEDVQALHRREVPALRVGPHVRDRGRERRARLAEGRPRRGPRRARALFPGWVGITAYNRGQVLYRIAEMMEGRRAEFAELSGGKAEVDEAIDTWIWYAGWADKLAQVIGSSNPVAGPYFNFTIPEPTGVVGIVAPEEPSAARARLARRARARRRERRRSSARRSATRSRRSRSPRCSRPRTSPAAS